METPPPDWDLLAVVRSCCTTTSTTTPTVDLPPPSSPSPPPLFHFPNVNPFITSPAQDLQDICNPLITPTPTTTTAAATTTTAACSGIFVSSNNNNITSFQPSVSVSVTSPVSSPSSSFMSTRSFGISTEQPQQQQQLRRMMKPTQVVFGAPHSNTSSTIASHSQGQRSKKRKNLMKRVCHVPAEGLSNDMWAWRKYGQKPIKGSPYPRGYYRCSSSKGCLARKQVERNRSDPKMFIVTYTAEHNHPMPTHRNSLAGSTRQKPTTTTTASGETTTTTTSTTTPDNPTCSSPSDNSLSPSKTENDEMKEDNGEDNDQMGLSELMLEDDFYVGFEQIDGDDGSDGFSDRFSPSMEFPWLVNSSSTATAAGGS